MNYMKTYKYLFAAAAFGLTLNSCYDLELEPKGIVGENVLLNSDNGIKKYLAIVYQDLPIEDFNYSHLDDERGYATVNQSGWHNGNVWQAQKRSPIQAAGEAVGFANTPGYQDQSWYWPYDRIRDINNFIAALPGYKDLYTETEYNEHLAEAYFLRAFYYFGLVKRYGGVPIVKEVLDPMASSDELQQPRDTEYDCWKFIHDDLEYAMQNGTTTKTPGRANRYAAAALMSRAMLYAGSIAKYGEYVTATGPAVDQGLMGMPYSAAEEFYTYSYNASKFLKEAGFKLHTGADKEQAYVEVFTNDCKDDEDIFVKQYTDMQDAIWNTSLFHCWDNMLLPKANGMSSDIGTCLHPVWELVGLFQLPAIVDENDNPVRFNSLDDFWDNQEMEPRARATFYFSGMKEQISGIKFDIQAGYYKSYPGTVYDGTPETEETDYTTAYRVISNDKDKSDANGKITGLHGVNRGNIEGGSMSGVLIRKYLSATDASARTALFLSKQPWKVFRYGEILCNWAEAAYELGELKNDESLKREGIEHVNELRDRAGARPYEYKASPEFIEEVQTPQYLGASVYFGYAIDENLQFIRDERERELCFENHRLFDIRRWRIADSMYDNYRLHVLYPYYVLSDNAYIYLPEKNLYQDKRVTWDKKHYYEQIPGDQIGKNPMLLRNDGY